MSQPGNEGIPHMSGMREATEGMHEMYLTLQQSGFSKDEALTLISGMLGSVIEQAISQKKSGA
jgi:hypothetical protein